MVRSTYFEMKAVAAALAAVFAGVSQANPVNPTVAAGQAAFQQVGKTLTVTNSPGAIINWKSFSIDRGELTRFVQQSASSQVLNRVTGVDPSVILGSLQSNGRVILINPNGVAFGAGAQVDVGGLIVSTLQLKDADFLAGKYKFGDTPGAGNIKNEGTIKTASGGSVILIAPNVENSGLIHTPEGQILLAAGKSVTIADPDKPSIQVEVTNSEHQAVNLGTLIGKEVSLYGGLVKNSGTIQATTAVIGQNGKIRLQAKNDVENTGTLQANGPQGGDILIQAQTGEAVVHGLVEAKSTATPIEIKAALQTTPTATETGKGGRIEILAPSITVDATVDASGSAGGGAILIGGEYQGGANPVPAEWSQNAALQRASLSLDNPYAASPSATEAPATTSAGSTSGDPAQQTNDSSQNNPLLPSPALPRARSTTIGVNARLRADALDDGDGGVIVAWSDGTTTAHGDFSAQGGLNGGNGGLAEVSGLQGIDVTGHADLSARQGHAGTMLLDPGSITISTAATNAATGTLNNTWVNTQLGTANLVLATTDAGLTINNATQDITVSAALNWNSANTLTLNAGRNIALNANITVSGGGGLTLNGGQSTTGSSSLTSNTILNLGGGSLVFGKGLTVGDYATVRNSTITSSDGTVLTTSYLSRLDGVTLGSSISPNLTISASPWLLIDNGLTLANGANVNIGSSYLSVNGNGIQTIGVAPGGVASLTMSGGYINANAAGATVTFGSGLSVNGKGSIGIGSGGSSLVNNGIINANDSTGTLSVMSANPLINNGSLVVSGGALTLGQNGYSWSNNGEIILTAGTLTLRGNFTTASLGNFSRSSGTTLNLFGSLNNSGQTLDVGVNGLGGVVFGGSIKNGTLISSGGMALTISGGGNLDGVTLGNADNPIFPISGGGDLYIYNGLTLANGAAVNLGNTCVSFEYDSGGVQTLGVASSGSANLILAGGSIESKKDWQTLIFGAGLNVSGSGVIDAKGDYYSNTLTNNGAVEANGFLVVRSDTISNGSTGVLKATGGNTLNMVGTVVNHGVVELEVSGAGLVINGNVTNANDGRILLSGVGTVDVSGSFASNDGLIDIAAGTTFKTNNTSLTNSSTGIIRGAGTLDLGYSSSGGFPAIYTLKTLTNFGTLDPGYGAGGVGTLTIKGNLVQGANGKLHIDLGGTVAGQYDQLVVTGITSPIVKTATAQLGGTLEVDETNGFHADFGNAFANFVTADGGVTGGFSSFSTPADVSFVANLSGAVGITDTTASLTRWAGDGNGDWATAANWTRGVPTATKDAVISRSSADPLVTVSTSGATARSLVVDDALAIDGQTLTIGSGLINGNVTLANGGSITTDGNLYPSGGKTLYWNDGTIDGTGGLNFVNGANIGFSGTGDRVMDSAGLNFSFTDLSLPSGSLTLRNGTLTFNTSSAGETLIPVGTSLNLYGGTLTNNGPLEVSGLFGLYGGTLAGSGAINMAGGTIDMPASSTVNWAATGAMNNSGTLNLANRTITNPITNTGTINAGAGLTFTQLFTNQGTFNLAGNTTTFSGGYSQSSGTTQLAGGTLAGNASFSGGTLTGAGTINGTLALSGAAYALGGSELWTIVGSTTLAAGASVGVNGGALTSAGLNVNGAFTLNNGTLSVSGPLNLNAGGSFTKSDAGTTLVGGAFNQAAGSTLNLNAGTLALAGGGSLAGSNYTPAAGATLSFSGGTFTLNGATSLGGTVLMSGSSFNGAGTLDNTGVLAITVNTTFATPFANSGTVTLSNGVTLTSLGGYTQTAGVTQLGTGAGTSATLNGNAAINGGALAGAGSIGGNLSVGAGTLGVGFSPGLLNISGNLTLSPSSVTNIELGGTTPGTGYDQINVNGMATLDGTLNVTTYGGYTPLAGDAFSFLTFGSSIGNFATINLVPSGISLNQYASYLELLMGGVIVPPIVPPSPSTPLEVLLETTAQTAETLATTPTSEGFTRVVDNDSDTSLGQIVVQLSMVDLNSAEEMEFQQCR